MCLSYWRFSSSSARLRTSPLSLKEERDVLEREFCEETEVGSSIDTVRSSEKIVAMLGGEWWLETANQVGGERGETFLCNA